jgi:hypothetical protein
MGIAVSPHPDLAPLFAPPKSTYWVSLLDTLKDIDPDLLADHDAEFNYSPQFSRLSEILEAEHLLFRQVWYNRHWNLRSEIEDGKHHVVPESEYSRSPYRQDQTLDTVWAGALAAAKRTEDEVGIENLGPWDDFEWGMINGKLSALRWVTGDEWDMAVIGLAILLYRRITGDLSLKMRAFDYWVEELGYVDLQIEELDTNPVRVKAFKDNREKLRALPHAEMMAVAKEQYQFFLTNFEALQKVARQAEADGLSLTELMDMHLPGTTQSGNI